MTDQELWDRLHRSRAKRRLELAAERCDKALKDLTLLRSQEYIPEVQGSN